MRENYMRSAFLLQLSLGGILSACSYLLTMEDQTQAIYFPAILLVYAPAVYLLNRLFLHRDRTIISWLFFNAALCAVLVVSVAMLYPTWPSGGWFPVTLFTGAATLRGAQLCQNPPKLSITILWLEISVVMLAIFLGIWATTGGSPVWCCPVGVGSAAALLAVIAHRMNGRMGAREWLLLLLTFACMGGILWLMVTFLAAPTGQGVIMAWSGLLTVLRTIGGGIQRFLTFLTSFLAPEHYEEVELADLSGMNIDTSANDAMTTSFGRILAIIVVVMIAAAALTALIVFGRMRLGTQIVKESARKKPKENRPSLLAGIKKMLKRVLHALQTRRALWTARNTELGIYYALVRLCKHTPLRQQVGDTPNTFLARLKEICSPDVAVSLEELRSGVEQALYSAKGASVLFPDGRSLKKEIKRQIRHIRSKTKNK